VTDKPLVG